MFVFLFRFLGDIFSKSPLAVLLFDCLAEPKMEIEDQPLVCGLDCPLSCGDEESSQSPERKTEEPKIDSSKHLTTKYFIGTEDAPSKVLTTENMAIEETENREGPPIQSQHNASELRFNESEEIVELQEAKRKAPPGFYRMRERKRQKERAKRRQKQQNQHPSGSNQTNSESNSPNRKHHSKSRFTRANIFGDMINGKITDTIPEDITVCLGSPSHDERIEKFRDMFHENRIAVTARKVLFEDTEDT